MNGTDTLAVVGDIHGNCSRLLQMLDILKETNRRVIFVGDYVNRGTDTKGVLDALIAFRDFRPESVFLLGNHEILLKEFLDNRSFAPFAKSGGLATIRSYIRTKIERNVWAHFRRVFPLSHYEFLEDCDVFWENEDYLISHTGVDPSAPNRRDVESMVLTGHQELFDRSVSGNKTVIVGHYHQASHIPFISNNFICLDSGCGSADYGLLSAVLLPEREFIAV